MNALSHFWKLTAFAGAILFASITHAGDFYEKDGAAIRGHDPVAFFTEGRPVKGSTTYSAIHKGSVFLFATAANRDLFKADPTRYAPLYDGYCAYGVASGHKVATDPAAFTIVDGKLYLNYNLDVRRKWSADIPGYLAQADKNWPAVSKQIKVVE